MKSFGKLTYPLNPTMTKEEFDEIQHKTAQDTFNKMEERWIRKR